jgi:hypothetical protein
LSQAKWPNLTYLDLFQSNIMSEGVKWICKSNWPLLKYLDLSKNDIQSEGVKQLIASNWPLLSNLSLCTFVIFRFQPNWE